MNRTATRNIQLQFVLTPESLQVISTRLILNPKQSLCKPHLKVQESYIHLFNQFRAQ